MTALLLAAVLATQQPDLRDAESVTRLLADQPRRMERLGQRRPDSRAHADAEAASAVRGLTPLLTNADAEVRTVAAWALGEIESASALSALEAVKGDRSPTVRQAVKWAIAQIDDRR